MIDREQATKTVQSLNDLMDQTGDFINGSSLEPKENSQADIELKSFARTESIITVWSQGYILIETAADHVMALIKILTEPVLGIASWTCLRAVLESAGLAVWLLDTGIDAKTRIQRSLAFRYEGLSEQAKLFRVTKDLVGLQQIEQYIETVEQVAQGLGFAKLVGKKNDRTGIAQTMPAIVEIIRDTLDEEVTYRLFSALAHAHPWAVQQVSFKKVEDKANDISLQNVSILEKHISSDTVVVLCRKAAVIFARPVWHKCRLFGWDKKQIETIFEKQFNEMKINPALWFWKQK